MKWLTLVGWGAIALVIGLISAWIAQQSYTWLPVAASSEAHQVDNLFAFLVFLGSIVFLGVGGFIVFTTLANRVSRFDSSDGPPIEGNVTLEVVWTVIPIVLVLIIAGYSYWTYDQMSIQGPMEIVHLHMGMESAYAADDGVEPNSPAVEAINVNAKQWAWEFHYPKQNVTSTELHVPVNQRVRLSLRSEDVLHGLYVPAFRLKQDIIPGKTIPFEFTPIREGTYRLQDSQFSGTYFAIAQTHVVVESPQQYNQWLETAAASDVVRSVNPAYNEFNKLRSKKGFKTRWATVPPALPPLVNQQAG
jgi:cytochrome c oxidase subunit II